MLLVLLLVMVVFVVFHWWVVVRLNCYGDIYIIGRCTRRAHTTDEDRVQSIEDHGTLGTEDEREIAGRGQSETEDRAHIIQDR